MNLQDYLNKMIKIQQHVLEFIDDEVNNDINFRNFQMQLDNMKVQEDICIFKDFLHFIAKIVDNHHRSSCFFDKIEQIILHYQDQIKQNFTNLDIFNIFKSNKRVLLFLFKNQFIIPTQNISDIITSYKYSQMNYPKYFFPEFQTFYNTHTRNIIEDEIKNINNFEEKRKIGENDNYACQLIRNDSIDEFIIYYNQADLSDTAIESYFANFWRSKRKKLKASIFETNKFLIMNEIELIDYAAFFGSIQIFNFLKMNNYKVSDLTWISTIHSANPEILHALEEESPEPSQSYKMMMNETIKCHQNDIVNYIRENFLYDKYEGEEYYQYIFKYKNFLFYPNDYHIKVYFNFLCKYNCIYLVKYLIETQRDVLVNDSILKILSSNANQEIIDLLLNLNCKNIKKYDFSNFHYIKRISLPSYVNSFNFSKCWSLQQVVFNGSITSIGDNAFRDCCSLQEIIFLECSNCINVGCSIFSGCKSLKSIHCNLILQKINISMFNGCESLSEFSIPYTASQVSQYAFKDCHSLRKIEILSSVTQIADFAFQNCSSIEKLTIPDSVISIGCGAFSGCSSLIEITFPPNLTSIDAKTFENCSSLKKVEFPSSMKIINNSAFLNCSSLTEVKISSEISLSSASFQGCSSLTIISLPDTMTSIKCLCFAGCSSLSEIKLPSSLTSIEYEAFKDCTSLKKIEFPPSLEIIGTCAFCNCSLLTEIKFPPAVRTIGAFAFSKCSNLTEIFLPSTVTFVSKGLFEGCSSLKEISIPDSITSINDKAFANCTSLTHVLINSAAIYISKTAFEKCESLSKVPQTTPDDKLSDKSIK